MIIVPVWARFANKEMITVNKQIYPVITGDVVNSAELEGYGESLEEVFSKFAEDYEDELPLEVDRYSGDQFQFLLESPPLSLRAALYIYTKLVSLQVPVPVRISIAIGKIDVLPGDRVSTGEGKVFRLSGSNLAEMRKYQRITFGATNGVIGQDIDRLFRGSLDLLSALLIKLSPTQAEAIWYKLKGYTQNEIARITGRKQQSVSDILIAGQWRNIRGFVETFEEVLNHY